MLGQITWALELLVAAVDVASMDLRLGVLLPPSHGPEDVIILIGVKVKGHGTLHRRRSDVLSRELVAGGDTYSLAVPVTNKLGCFAVVTHPTVQ